eukprot:1157613-Pelagomonas_calceolata.AAC.7
MQPPLYGECKWHPTVVPGRNARWNANGAPPIAVPGGTARRNANGTPPTAVPVRQTHSHDFAAPVSRLHTCSAPHCT